MNQDSIRWDIKRLKNVLTIDMLNYVCINYMQIIKQRAGAFKCHDVQPNQVKYNDNCLKHGRKI